MKNLIFLMIFPFSLAFGQEANVLDGLLNVAKWIDTFNSVIEGIDNKESLKKLNRELSYLATDINEITNSKKRLDFKITRPNSEDFDYKDEVRYLRESIAIFQGRFRDINNMIPAEFKVEENPFSQNIDSLIWQKIETMENLKSMLYDPSQKDEELLQELERAIATSGKIEMQINTLKLKIEEKLK